MTDPAFYLRWARPDNQTGAHGETPTVSECEAEGWRVVGGDPRYSSVLMWREVEQ